MPRPSRALKHLIETEIPKLTAEHRGRHLRVVLAMLCAYGLSCWLTAKGIFDKTIEAGVATPEGMITAMMSAAVAATLIGAGTIMLFGVAMNAARHQRWQIASLIGSLLPFILGISTYFAALANAGPASLVYDMRDRAGEHIAYYQAMMLDASGAQTAHAALSPLQVSVCELAEGEGERGVLTGSPGKQAVYAAYFSGCKNITEIVRTLSDTVSRTAERRDQAAAILAALKAIPKDTSISVFERQAAFRDTAGELRRLIEDSSAERVSERLKAQLEILEASVATLGVHDGTFGERQSIAIENLKATLGIVSDMVSSLLDESATDTPEPPAELLEMGAAVAVYWQRNIPQILLAVMIDCMTLWFAGLLVVSRGTVDARRDSLTSQSK